MKAARILTQVRDAISHLDPEEVRREANLPFSIRLFASNEEGYRVLENFFVPAEGFSPARRAESSAVIHRGSGPGAGTVIEVYEEGVANNGSVFVFRRMDPDHVVKEILDAYPELKLSLARRVCAFRPQVAKDIMLRISKENALFSVATAVPSMVPLLSLPWAVGEFASDTAFLTANQIRMAFMLAAASDRKVSYREQRAEIASLFAGAFGWRAIARELVGKVPFGGGILPKAAIAFAGTYVVGASLERFYRVGYGYTAEERHAAYAQALERGKEIAASLMRTQKSNRA